MVVCWKVVKRAVTDLLFHFFNQRVVWRALIGNVSVTNSLCGEGFVILARCHTGGWVKWRMTLSALAMASSSVHLLSKWLTFSESDYKQSSFSAATLELVAEASLFLPFLCIIGLWNGNAALFARKVCIARMAAPSLVRLHHMPTWTQSKGPRKILCQLGRGCKSLFARSTL